MSCWDRIRCVVFDFDGTLVESNAIKRDSFFEIFDGFERSEAVVERVLSENPDADRHAIVPAVRDALSVAGVGSLPEPTALVAAYTELCEARVAECPAVPGAQEALECLRGRYPLYLDSSTPQDALARIVERRGWSRYFRAVLGRPTDKLANLRILADREKLAPREILLVGDGPSDRAAALEFRCAFLGFGRGFGTGFGTEDANGQETLREHRGLGCLAPLVDQLRVRAA